jgi:hypothetical protein
MIEFLHDVLLIPDSVMHSCDVLRLPSPSISPRYIVSIPLLCYPNSSDAYPDPCCSFVRCILSSSFRRSLSC